MMPRSQTRAVCILLFCASALIQDFVSAKEAETRFHQYTRQFENPKNPATPLAAGYLGGGGDENLCGGAFLPDGSLILAGTAFGPKFNPKGANVVVLGKDAPAPSFTMPMKEGKKGKDPRPAPPNWTYTKGAGFIVQLSANYKTIQKAVRFPWGSGSLTDIATDTSGAVYVTGLCGEHFGHLATAKRAAGSLDESDDLFVGRLKPDLSGFVWLQTLSDSAGTAPKLHVLDDGSINLTGKNAYHLSAADGEVTKSTNLSLTNSWVRGVDPATHATSQGGDTNTNTGYEPWRRPGLTIRNSEGECTDVFYQWNEKLVGMNCSRRVSDSDVRLLNYDHNGNLLLYGWSDGGNTVFEMAPYDMRRSVQDTILSETGKKSGLGFSTWGASVGSFCHLVKIDPRSGEPLAKTLFAPYRTSKNAPANLKISMMDVAADDSVVIGGGSDFGLIETIHNKVNTLDYKKDDYIGGAFVTVLTPSMDDIRFSSVLPGGGKAPLTRHSSSLHGYYASGSAEIGGKTRVVIVSAAEQHDAFKSIDPAQDGFGGGLLDGQYVVLEMDSYVPNPKNATPPDEPKKKRRKEPEPLTGEYSISEGMDREWCVLVLRDLSGKKWPSIYRGAPKGTATVDASGSGTFVLYGPGHEVQFANGSRQSKRLGGEFVRTVSVTDRKGKTKEKAALSDLVVEVALTSTSSCSGTVRLNDQTVKLDGECTIVPSKPTGKGINISGRFATTKGALGLDADDPGSQDDEVQIEFWTPARP